MAKLHTQNLNTAINPTDMDRSVYAYIEKYSLPYYDELLTSEDRFPVFSNLSVLRTGILSWYQFKEGAEVLEIGAGFGALTGMLCEKCAHVTATERSAYRAQALARRWQEKDNLDVFEGEWSEIVFGHQFDYIIITGILESAGGGSKEASKYTEYIQRVMSLLKPEGILLFAVENRYGLKYFCGAAEPHSNKAFDGINHYPNGTRGYSFSRQELTRIIEKAGVSSYKFYYPLPDYKLPQLIFTDAYLPEKNLSERLIPYYQRNDTLVAVESGMYDDIISNGVFPFFANSFIVECGRENTFCDVVYAAVSTDRGTTHGYATTIHETKAKDGETSFQENNGRVVYKTPLFSDGMKNAMQLYENINDLKAHGIPAVDLTYQEAGLQMPYIALPTLSNYLKQLITQDIERFKQILDELYAFILSSSEEVDAQDNLLPSKCKIPPTECMDWGPVLRKAYMELIPLNCFYNEENKHYLFFDQEFVRENYPAKYVLFRAIHYIYCFTPGAEGYLPQKFLRDKYGMEETWKYYLEEENRFLSEIRRHNVYQQFYKWSKIDRQKIYQNAGKLESEAEVIANYKISDKMKKIWKVELQMLDEVAAICKKYNIRYFMMNGTLLGAVRHKGFIPWDDDLDIGMLREDYDKFLEVAAKELPEPLFLQTMWNEPDCFFGGYARIRNSITTAIQEREIEHNSNQGIWMDILPLDVCTENESKLRKKSIKIRHYQRLLHAKIYGGDFNRHWDLSTLQWWWFRILAGCHRHDQLCQRLDAAMRLYTYEESRDAAVFSGYFQHRILNGSDFRNIVYLPFEERNLPAPVGYENYLFMMFGKDYLKYPPEEERKPKHNGIFDPEKPYTEYLNAFSGLFKDVKGKNIILFGSGEMFKDYMKKWGNRYRPAFLVDNDENKWGRKRMGIEIKSPQALLGMPPQKRKLIICSFYYKEIAKQLEEMGIKDYQVYIQRMDWILKEER